jgi:broad specificity phosphatase PhoE
MSKFLLGICFLAISSSAFAEPQTWYFVRHFEKQVGDNPSLTEVGKDRAEALAAFFSDKSLTHIFSTNYNRTLETATPVSELKSVEIKNYNPRNLGEFASKIKALNQVLVVGHSNTTPELLRLMGGAYITIAESEYGTIYVLKRNKTVLDTSDFYISLN